MLFRRRNPPAVGERIRIFFVPRRNYGRSFKYYGKRVLRLTGSPHAIAAGIGAGAAASFTPLLGFHFFLSFAIAFILRGNMIAAAIGTVIGNPLTFPFIWLLDFRLGTFIQGIWRDGPPRPLPPNFLQSVAENGWEAIEPLLWPIMIGALPLSILAGLSAYALTRSAVGVYQESRRKKLAERRGEQRGEPVE
jgi:uncharacterized protein (DUF2062 family)